MNSGIAGGTDTTPPTAPTGLSAAAMSMSQINLSWTASTDNVMVAGYRVERCQGTGVRTSRRSRHPRGRASTTWALPRTTSYSYRVRAVRCGRESERLLKRGERHDAGGECADLLHIHPRSSEHTEDDCEPGGHRGVEMGPGRNRSGMMCRTNNPREPERLTSR